MKSAFLLLYLLFGLSLHTISTAIVSASSNQNEDSIYNEIYLGKETLPVGIYSANDGTIWLAEANTDTIIHINQAGLILNNYSISNRKHLAWIWSMVEDDYNTLWIADETQDSLLRLNLTSGVLQNVSTGGVRPYCLAYDPNSETLWFTSFDDSSIGKIKIHADSANLEELIKVPGISAIGAGPAGIALGPGYLVFVAASLNSSIDEFYGSNMSLIKVWYLRQGSQPVGLSYDWQRNLLWFTNHASSLFGFISLGNGSITEYATSIAYSQGLPIVSLPYWIHISSSGIVWFNEHFGNKIAAFDLNSGQLIEFKLPENNSSPLQLAVDDNTEQVWFTEFTTGIAGSISEGAIPRIKILSPVQIRLSPFSTNFEVDVKNYSTQIFLSGSMNSLGLLNENMSASISKSENNSVYQITLSGLSLEYNNYTLTACFPFYTNDLIQTNVCKVIYLTYQYTPSQNQNYFIFPLLVLLAIVIYYIYYQSKFRRKRRFDNELARNVTKGLYHLSLFLAK